MARNSSSSMGTGFGAFMKVVFFIACVAAAFWIGSQMGPRSPATQDASRVAAKPREAEVWTCSMHPQIRLDRPGNCPICEMPLIPAGSGQSNADGTPTLTLSPHAMAMASVETTPVTRQKVSHQVRAVGKVQYNETSLATVTARVGGYAEKLFVNYMGMEIKAGDHLAEVYSPELLVAQQELLTSQVAGIEKSIDLVTGKLRRWGLTETQIRDLVESRKITDRITLYSPIDGTVIEKNILENSAFKAGDALFRLANLDTVWAYLEIYEFDLSWIRYGQHVSLTTEAYPGRVFNGMVTFVQPVLSEETRTIRVPVHIENRDHALKPGMFVSAAIGVTLTDEGKPAPTGVEGKYSCPMHPQVLQDEGGSCPYCGMPLEKIPETATVAKADAGKGAEAMPRYYCPMKCEGEKTYDQPGRCPVCNMKLVEVPTQIIGKGLLVVPATAVLDNGLRRLVYVDMGGGTFEPRDVTVGPRTDDSYPILQGLREGEQVVTRGGFLIDSQFQVTGHSSLFYPGGLHASMGQGQGESGKGVETPTPAKPGEQSHKH